MKLIVLNKPFDVLSQFREDGDHETLQGFIDDPSLRVAGRLDRDSEGLLLLTDHGGLNQFITNPKHKQFKTYLAQVEGDVTEDAVQQLIKGVELNDGLTLPAKVRIVEQPEWLWERNPPIRFRLNVPTTWLEIQICEGRNRQVRRMTATVGYPTLRLIRTQVGSINLIQLGLEPGDQRAIEPLLYPELRNLPEDRYASRTGQRNGSGRSFKPNGKFSNQRSAEEKSPRSEKEYKKSVQKKKRDKVRAEIFNSDDAPKVRRITNGTTRPNTKSRGRRPR